eukprot:3561156-Prymnesium_polylepis.1
MNDWSRDKQSMVVLMPREEEASRAPEARCCRVQRSHSPNLVSTASAVTQSIGNTMSAERFSHAHCTVVTCARAVSEVSSR